MTDMNNAATNPNLPADTAPVPNCPEAWNFSEESWVGTVEEGTEIESPEGLCYTVRRQLSRGMWVAETFNGKVAQESGLPLGFELGYDPRRAGRYLTSLGFCEA